MSKFEAGLTRGTNCLWNVELESARASLPGEKQVPHQSFGQKSRRNNYVCLFVGSFIRTDSQLFDRLKKGKENKCSIKQRLRMNVERQVIGFFFQMGCSESGINS